MWILGRSCLIFVVFWVSIVLTSFGGGGFNEWWWWWLGGDGWTMLGGWWDLRYSGGALAGSVRLDGCLCLCVLKKEDEDIFWFIEGQYGNCLTHPNKYIKTRTDFWQNGPEELQIWDARSLRKYKTQLFPKSCVLY